MKHSLICGSILLLAPIAARAQLLDDPALEPAPSLKLTPRPAQTPALDAFAGLGSQLQLQARWVQIDAAVLPAALPAWNRPGDSSHVATPDELKTLQILSSTGTASISDQQINAMNNQNANLSFSPFTRFQVPLSAPVPLDDMIVPREESSFVIPFKEAPYIPNLAKPESNLPEMAPMPNFGSEDFFQLPRPSSSTRPQMSPELADLMAYKFQIRPTIIGSQVALQLRSLNSADNIEALARADYGQTVVFSLPNILQLSGNNKQIRRAFLLVTPRLDSTPQPKRDLR